METHTCLRRAVGMALIAVVLILIWTYWWLLYGLPVPDRYDCQFTGARGDDQCRPLALPDALRWATVAAEDRGHFTADSPDVLAVLRAALVNIECARQDCLRLRAASITQMLAVELQVISGSDPAPSLRRDMRDLVLTVKLDRNYTRDENLDRFIALRTYGMGIRGVEAAAENYYGKHVGDLNVAECAMLAVLAGMQDFEADRDLVRAEARFAYVLGAMVDDGYISEATAAEALDGGGMFDY